MHAMLLFINLNNRKHQNEAKINNGKLLNTETSHKYLLKLNIELKKSKIIKRLTCKLSLFCGYLSRLRPYAAV